MPKKIKRETKIEYEYEARISRPKPKKAEKKSPEKKPQRTKTKAAMEKSSEKPEKKILQKSEVKLPRKKTEKPVGKSLEKSVKTEKRPSPPVYDKKEADKKETPKRNQSIRWILAIAIVAVIIYGVTQLDFLAPENISGYLSGLFGGDGGGNYPIPVPGSDVIGLSCAGDDLLVTENGKVTLYSKTGAQLYKRTNSFTSPRRRIGGDVLVYDHMGKDLNIESKTKTTEKSFENSIITADIGKSGAYCVVTDSSEFSFEMAVYDKSGDERYRWRSAFGNASDTAISDDGKYAAVITYALEDGRLSSRLHIFDTGIEGVMKEENFPGVMALSVDFKGSLGIIMIGDKKSAYIPISGEAAEIDYNGDSLLCYSNDGADGGVFALSGLGSDGSITVYSINSGGKQTKINTEIKSAKSVGCSVGRVYVLSDGRVLLYENGIKTMEAEVGYDCKKLAAFPEFCAVSGNSEIKRVDFKSTQ